MLSFFEMHVMEFLVTFSVIFAVLVIAKSILMDMDFDLIMNIVNFLMIITVGMSLTCFFNMCNGDSFQFKDEMSFIYFFSGVFISLLVSYILIIEKQIDSEKKGFGEPSHENVEMLFILYDNTKSFWSNVMLGSSKLSVLLSFTGLVISIFVSIWI